MATSVRVHGDTHRALKELKVKKRSSSIDQVIRDMIKATTGTSVEELRAYSKADELTTYLES